MNSSESIVKPKQLIYSWTASHIESEGRFYLLTLMIDSLIKSNIDVIQISISFSKSNINHILLNQMINELNELKESMIIAKKQTRIEFYSHDYQQKYQFDHLNYLSKNFKGNDFDIILFMDDDDLYLHDMRDSYSPDQEQKLLIIKGLQYIPLSTVSEDKTFQMSRQEILDIESKYKTRWNIDIDFSGYMATFQIVDNYFKNVRKEKITKIDDDFSQANILLRNLEDIQFMDYLDKLFSINNENNNNNKSENVRMNKTPSVFHRLWSCTTVENSKSWLTNMNVNMDDKY